MLFFDILFFGILLIVAYIDFKTHYIYDCHLIIASVIVAGMLLYSGGDWIDSIEGAVAGFLIGYLMYKIAYLYYKEEAFGFGDVLLLAVLGFYFGLYGFFSCFSITYMLLGVILIVPIIVKPSIVRMSVPMAPVYVIGALVYKFMGSPGLIEFLYDLQRMQFLG